MTKKIIFCLRRDYQKIPAGDIVQMEQWKRVLSQLNCDVTIFSGDIREEDMLDADIVFIWHLERLHESLPFWKIAKKLNKEIWLVPTCWQNNSNLSPLKNIIEETKLFLRRILFPRSFSCGEKFSGWAERRKRLLHESSLLLVNSAAEKQFLLAQGADETKVIVIPNTINAVELEKIPQLPPEKRSGIIHVGHFCPRKNQLKLIKQLKNSGNGRHAGGKGDGPGRLLQAGYRFLQMGSGGVGQTGIVKPVGAVAQVRMGKGCGLVNGHGQAVTAVGKTMVTAVDAAGLDGVGHGITSCKSY